MKKSILIIDDDISIRTSLNKILTEDGYEVVAAPDGDSAEGKFEKADLLILDLNLPIQDGWDVLGFVNSNFPLLPVIVITGLADQLDEKTIPGASAFMEKPIEVPLLLETVTRLLSQTPEERLEGFSRGAESRQIAMTRPGYLEKKSRVGPVFRKFRAA